MKARLTQHLLVALLGIAFTADMHAQGTAFTYQGFLTQIGAPAKGPTDFEFRLYDDSAAGAQQGGTVTLNEVGVTNGLFTVSLDFGASVFDGSALWLDIAVRPGASMDAYTNLAPRQPILSAPFAVKAANAMTVALGAISDPSFLGTTTPAPLILQVSNTVGWRLEYPASGTVPNLVGGYSGNSVGTGTEGAVIAGGGTNDFGNSIGENSDYGVIGGGYGNNISNNSSYATIAGGHRNDINSSWGLIGGGDNNNISIDSFGATIAGGVNNDIGVDSDWTFIGGGRNNNISNYAYFACLAGGVDNTIASSSPYSFIGGGIGNTISNQAYRSVITGGANNTIGLFSDSCVISGGVENEILENCSYGSIAGGISHSIGYLSDFTFIGGGAGNSIQDHAEYSVILGGSVNGVGSYASYALAAGHRAKANHQGAFVWADSQNADFASTANNQFSVRASGGIRFLGDIQLGDGGYQHLQTSGGNAWGYLYGSFPAFADGIHLGYNYYADAGGVGHVSNAGGATSRLTVGYGFIRLSVGGVNSAPTVERLAANGSGVTVFGTFNNLSDRASKQDFETINTSDILDKVLALPLSEWSYKEDPLTRHIGPVAQDFQSIFKIGTDDKHIAPIDEGGVALAAIQGLNQKLEAQNLELRRQNAELLRRLEAIEERLR